jgi:hypothetical protein
MVTNRRTKKSQSKNENLGDDTLERQVRGDNTICHEQELGAPGVEAVEDMCAVNDLELVHKCQKRPLKGQKRPTTEEMRPLRCGPRSKVTVFSSTNYYY